jgi:hypothetical protein
VVADFIFTDNFTKRSRRTLEAEDPIFVRLYSYHVVHEDENIFKTDKMKPNNNMCNESW